MTGLDSTRLPAFAYSELFGGAFLDHQRDGILFMENGPRTLYRGFGWRG